MIIISVVMAHQTNVSLQDVKYLIEAIDDDENGTVDCLELVNYIEHEMAQELT